MKAREIARGAEAVIEEEEWFGKKVVRKHRIPKGYRIPELDQELRKSRTRAEARLLRDARNAGFPTPHILDLDEETGSLIMEYIEGPTAKVVINKEPQRAPEMSREMGRLVGILHGAGMVHGDLTTSNIICSPSGLVFIDMSLGGKDAGDEEMGVDIHLIKEAMESTHNHIPGLFNSFLEGYKESFACAERIEKKMREIESRGRYT
ncbi:MAG: KEOPS complex kinase/ATPase Bud32 [Candidatus Thermoplasmatota archaeon]|nr:KEOPS complex kinase/ATPase Bud32 [Candidatus Thermoplasmatota archaeon]